MTAQAPQELSLWIARHSLLVWIGILVNLFFVVPLLFNPAWILGLLDIPADDSVWPRFAGLLLLIVSIYYVPPTIDLERYRANAWLAVFPSRTFGATFFFVAVFVFDLAPGLIVGALVDGSIGLATLYCLIKITALERSRGLLGEAA